MTSGSGPYVHHKFHGGILCGSSPFVHDCGHLRGFRPPPTVTEIEVEWHVVPDEPIVSEPPLLLAAPKSEFCAVCGSKKEVRHHDRCTACEELSVRVDADPVRACMLLDGPLAVGKYLDGVGLAKPFYRGRVWLRRDNYDQPAFVANIMALLAMAPESVTEICGFVEVRGRSPMFSAPRRGVCPLYDVDVELGKHCELRLKSVRQLTEEEAFERERTARPMPVKTREMKTLQVGESQSHLGLPDRVKELGVTHEVLGLPGSGLTTDQILESSRQTDSWIDKFNFFRKRGDSE